MNSVRNLTLPPIENLVRDLRILAEHSEPIALCLSAAETGWFRHPDGRSEALEQVVLPVGQLALTSYLSKECVTNLTIDIGFGMGSSATTIVGTRAHARHNFLHIAFDPYGLGGERGLIVNSYLETGFPENFKRIWKRSEMGMAQLLEEKEEGAAGLIFIDGSHTFEAVMVDFVFADRLCAVGGYIVFDDALYPAIEAVINYVLQNRPNFECIHYPELNCTVLKKTGQYYIPWDAFQPFTVPERSNWTIRPDSGPNSSPHANRP